MPGQPLDIDLPLQSDNVSDAIAKIADDLQVIQTDLEAKVVAAEIDVNGNLDFNGWRAISLSCVTFSSVADPDDFPAASVVYSGGEFWMVTADGSIQMTLNGTVNAATSGAIVGAGYGSSGAFVTFNAGAGQYEFTTTGGGWADGIFDDIVLKGAAGETRLSTLSSLVGAHTLQFSLSAPASGAELVLLDNAGTLLRDSEVNGEYHWTEKQDFETLAVNVLVEVRDGANIEASNATSVTITVDGTTGLTVEGVPVTLVGTADIHRAKEYETRILPHKFMALSDSTLVSNQAYGVLVTAGGNQIKIPFPMLIGEQVTQLKVPLATVGGTGTASILCRVINADGTVAATLFNSTQATTTTQTDYTINITDHTLVTGQSIDVTISGDAARNTQVGGVGLLHKRP